MTILLVKGRKNTCNYEVSIVNLSFPCTTTVHINNQEERRKEYEMEGKSKRCIHIYPKNRYKEQSILTSCTPTLSPPHSVLHLVLVLISHNTESHAVTTSRY